jgi:putative cardiolipin synthase
MLVQPVFSLWNTAIFGRCDPCAIAARFVLVIFIARVLGSCAELTPGADFPKIASVALAHPEGTRLGGQFARAARAHGGTSGFRILTVGIDGFLTRVQMIDAAERTLDLQYFIFRGDETGRLLTDALRRAADRGVRVRVLIDDGDTIAGDEQIIALDAHRAIEIRVFNPFAYRGHGRLLRTRELLFNASRLDYRMHNKLLVADNAVALIGGRNIGNQYFQMDSESQFADDDVLAAGPIAEQLSATFDEYWNSRFAIPVEALGRKQRTAAALADHRKQASERHAQPLQALKTGGIDYIKRIATGEPYGGMISGKLPLVWAQAQVVCDSPDKKHVENGALGGRLMTQPVGDAASAVQSELLMVTPFFIPADEEVKLLKDLRQRQVRVRILTNSLESTPDLAAQSGYLHYRVPLLEQGVELYEVRSLLGNARGSGQTAKLSRYGNYALHAKLFVFDRRKVFIGSMNFDQRSKRINTEVGLIIDSPELAQQTAIRFEAMAQPENSYALALRPGSAGSSPRLVWHTQEDGKAVEYEREPARSAWQRLKVKLLSLLPLDREL